ncbi:MAG: hypothetical protein KH375_05090 [Alistipes sp.]|nr:hypothetical protein [Alistipes sp.]
MAKQKIFFMLYFIVLSRVDDRVELESLKTRKKVWGTLQSPDTIVFDDDGGDVNHRITRILPSDYKLSVFSDGVYPFVTDDNRKLLYDITAELVPLADIVQVIMDGSIIEAE